MKIKKAFWTSLALAPAGIIPLSTATSCSQAWGFKTPLSIGSSIKGSDFDPFVYCGHESCVDLNGDPILPQLQSNFAIDTRSNTFYGYSLPEKWNKDKQDAKHPAEGETSEGVTIKWNKGSFENGSAGWYNASSSEFTKSADVIGDRSITSEGKTDKVGEAIYSYRNNTLSSVIDMIGYIGTTISSCINYALQYQGTQIGSKYGADQAGLETNTNLATAWGGYGINHGAIDSKVNRKFFESIFASNAVSGTGKSRAIVHPTHVEFTFNADCFPIPAYKADDGKIVGVHNDTKALLNNSKTRPSESTKEYWSSKSDVVKEKVYNIRNNKTEEWEYTVYTYTNVPVVVSFESASKAFVNPTIKNGFMVSDFYSETKDIKDSIGKSWETSLPKFARSGKAEPTYSGYTFDSHLIGSVEGHNIEFKETNYDERIAHCEQNTFVALVNYAYKEYSKVPSGSPESYDRVTMTGITTVFPTYFLDKIVDLGVDNWFKKANNVDDGKAKGFIVDEAKINKYNNLFFELLKRSSGQGLITEANNLNKTSKELLKFLAYMFGDGNLKIDTSSMIKTYPLSE